MFTLSCPAKINLFLAIKEKDESGYHEIETVMARTDSLCDQIEVEEADIFSFECDEIPCDNTVVKAVRILEQESGKTLNYKIRLIKNIPPKSGLGGGSSDAAAILTFLNEHAGLHFSRGKLMELATKIGMDVPFFVSGYQLAYASHFGEELQELPPLPENLLIEIHQTGIEVSTADAYKKWDEIGKLSTATANKMIQAIKTGNSKEIIDGLHNDFELIFSSQLRDRGWILAGSGGAYAFLSEFDMTSTK